MDNQGYYAILGVSQKANFQEIKKSYRRLAKKYHPDRNKSPNAEETIKKINQAFEILSDRKKLSEKYPQHKKIIEKYTKAH